MLLWDELKTFNTKRKMKKDSETLYLIILHSMLNVFHLIIIS